MGGKDNLHRLLKLRTLLKLKPDDPELDEILKDALTD